MNNTTNKEQLESRRAWREKARARQNRSSAWLVEQARHEAGAEDGEYVRPSSLARCHWPLGRVGVQLVDGKAAFRNLEHCHSSWACPYCTPLIRSQHAVELQEAVDEWGREPEHRLLFVTLTCPHRLRDPLAASFARVNAAWSGMNGSGTFAKFRRAHGVRHWVRAIEVTWSAANGWHAHAHALLFLDGPAPDIEGMRDELYLMWSGAVVARGGRKPSWRRGVDCTMVAESPEQVASYLSKAPDHNQVSDEITRMDNKQGRGPLSFGPFELLDEPAGDMIGSGKAKRLWLEYASATKGGHSLTWSGGMRDALGLGREKSDRQIIDDANSGNLVFDLEPKAYRRLAKNPNMLSQFQKYVETGEVPLALQLLAYTAGESQRQGPAPSSTAPAHGGNGMRNPGDSPMDDRL
jgi:hypothetical protein